MIVADTSFLLEMVKRKIDLPRDMKLLIPTPVYRELKKLARNKGKKGSYAKAALEIAKHFYLYPTWGEPDKAVIWLSHKYKLPVLTYDLALAKKAHDRVRVKGTYVEWDEDV